MSSVAKRIIVSLWLAVFPASFYLSSVVFAAETASSLPHLSYQEFSTRFAEPVPVGKGTFGEVFAAREKTLGLADRIAVKISDERPAYFSYSLREVEIIRRLQHSPFVVQFKNAFILVDGDKKSVALVIELLSHSLFNECLEKHSSSRAKPVLGEMQKVAFSVLMALHELHRLEFIHTDVKPENIMRRFDGSVCLIDFSSVRHQSANTYFDITSLPYRAPEVLNEDPYSSQLDLWSLGSSLFALYVGVDPFLDDQPINGKGAAAVARARLRAIKSHSSTKEMLHAYLERHIGAEQEKQVFINFLESLLAYNPKERLTTQGALEHPFIRELSSISEESLARRK